MDVKYINKVENDTQCTARTSIISSQSRSLSGHSKSISSFKKYMDEKVETASSLKTAKTISMSALLDIHKQADVSRNSKTFVDAKNDVVSFKRKKSSDNADCSESQFIKKIHVDNIPNMNTKSNIIYSKVPNAGKDKYIGLKITNINDLKKATPRLKLPSILSSVSVKKASPVSEEIKEKLHKYCRTCAGLKVPLVNIFSEKGVQMRLNQQIQHLEDIDEHDSLSTQMCMDCICDLKMSYKFFMQIKKAEIKLKSISNSLIDTITKIPRINTEDQIEEKSSTKYISEVEEPLQINNDSILIDNIKCETEDYVSETYSDRNDDFEEYEPDLLQKSPSHDASVIDESELCLKESTPSTKDATTKFNQLMNSYVRLEKIKESLKNGNKLNANIIKSDPVEKVIPTESANQPLKVPNILKRKLSSGNTNDETNEKSNKLDLQKFNIDLKDLKIPKLNLDDTANIKKEENGVMYVTAKGSKPNEMLLIKVKKMDKTMEKKGEKSHGKKKGDSNALHKIFPKYENSPNKHGSYIDEQIEEYKKRRVKILGETANLSEEEVPEIRVVGSDIMNNTKTLQIMNYKTKIKKEEGSISHDVKELPSISPQYVSRLEKLKQRWKDIKKRHDNINKDLAEDCSDRLRAILKQRDEYIQDFMSYLKQRRIVVSRLKDEDIISLYEAKNNVVLEKLIDQPEEASFEDYDPFEFREEYDCDFCDQSFPHREMEFEHSKIHDFKLMHYCDDCKQEFSTHKAKRSHNGNCEAKLICKYCHLKLESKGKKRQHEQKHCDEQNGQLCDLCGEKFKHFTTLDQHIKSRHMQLEKIFKCPQCSKRFAFRTKLTFHLKSVHTTCRAFLCEDCGSDFKNPASLRHHRIRKHMSVNNKKECTECHKMIPVYSMSKHMHTHKAYTIQCPHCDKMFKNTSTLKQHVRIHEDQRQYKCDMCGVGFNRRDGLRLHLKVHQKTDSKGLKECSCQVCGEKFPNHSMLVIHRNRTHKDGRNYTCHICNRSMISTRSLEWHLAHIHNEMMPGIVRDDSSADSESKRVSCYHCDKTFKTEMILRTHVKNTHVEKEPMKCLDCDLLFTSEVRLKHHMMTMHNRLEGTLGCPHCTKRFVNQLRLKTHMISHSNERPFSCDLCGFLLKTKIQLIKHKQNRHSNERPLQCKYCSWRCKQVSALVCHERTHTNERPYSCSVCKQKFKYLGDKNKHERRHESLGGSGFKRIVSGRKTVKFHRTKEEDSTEHDSEQERDEYEIEQGDEYEEQIQGEIEEEIEEVDGEVEEEIEAEMEGEVEAGVEAEVEISEDYNETQIIKFESTEIVEEEAEGTYEQIFIEEASQDVGEDKVVIGMEETAVYAEEVTTDDMESHVITNDIINEHMLQPGTVVHLQQEDETGKIQVIPVMLSLPDLTDNNSEVSLATASIMYNS